MINIDPKLSKGVIFVLEDTRLAGPHVYVARLCKGLKISSRVLIPRSKHSKTFKGLLKKNGVKVSETFFLSRLSREPLQIIYYLLMFIPEIIALTIIFLKSKEKLVYCAGGSWQIKGALAGYLSRKLVVWHLNDTHVPSIIMKIFRRISFLATAYIHASEATKTYYLDSLSDRPSAVIPAPIDTELFLDEIKFQNLEEKEKIVLGMICNINPTKNLEDFIMIADNISSEMRSRFEFRIIGPTFDSQQGYKKRLEKMIEELDIPNIFFYGPTEDISSSLRDLDIFLFTSKSESSPLVVWEALMSGLPVVTYRVGDIDKYIKNEFNGLTAEVFDKAAMCRAIDLLICDYNLANNLKTNARKTAIEFFSHTKCAELHVEYLSRLI